MHSRWKPSAGHRVAEGRQAADGAGGWPGSTEEVDAELEEPDAGAQREVHLQGVQPRRGDQRHVQS